MEKKVAFVSFGRNTDDKVLNVKLPMRNNYVNKDFDVKVFDMELHMVDDCDQLPEKF